MRNIRRLWIHVALQAQEAAFTAEQELSIDRPMRRVTARASLDLHCSVFKDKRTTLFRMAVDASFPCRFSQHWLIVRAVRVVAIRTLHQAFGNTMMSGQCKLGLHCRMTRKTQPRLRLAQETLIQPTVTLGNARSLGKLRLAEGGFGL